MKRGISVLSGAVLALAALPVTAVQLGDAERGRELATTTCQACHGESGNTTNPQFPKLAGQYSDYIIAALQQYKSGVRQNALMNGIAGQLSLQDMRDLGAYFEKQEGDLYTPSR